MRILGLALTLLFWGCGYKPLSHYAKETFGDSVYVEVKINPDFPKAGVSLKDILNRAILTKLHLRLASREEASGQIDVEVSSIKFDMLAQDPQGFANHYSANVEVKFSYTTLYHQEIIMTLSGSQEYASTDKMTTLLIEKAQIDAINSALTQAVDAFISKLFYQGVTHQKALKNEQSKQLSR